MSDELTPEKLSALFDQALRHVREEAMITFDKALQQRLFRAHLAHWEVAELLQLTSRLASLDAPRAADFEDFRNQWIPLIGLPEDDDALGWLVPIYLAVVSSPTSDPEARHKLALSAIRWM